MKESIKPKLGFLVLPIFLGFIQIHPAKCTPSEVAPASSSVNVIDAPPLVEIPELLTSDIKREQLSTCITAIAAQSDPAKLATLGSRGANPRLKRILYWLAAARDTGADPEEVIDEAQKMNHSFGTPRAPLVKTSLLRNLKICDGLDMLTPGDRGLLRRGNAPVVNRGPYKGQVAEVDHIVPLAQAYEIGNELGNLELLPSTLNRAKSDKVGERQLDLAKKFYSAGLISEVTMANVQSKFRPSSTVRHEHSMPDMKLAETPTPAPTPFIEAPQVASIQTPEGQPVFFWWPQLLPGLFPPLVVIPPISGSNADEGMVWVNTSSHVYHLPHSHWYGRTRNGKYVTVQEAVAEGDREAKNHE